MALSTLTLLCKHHYHPFQNCFQPPKLKYPADKTVIPHIHAPTTNSASSRQPRLYLLCLWIISWFHDLPVINGYLTETQTFSRQLHLPPHFLFLDTGPCLLHPGCLNTSHSLFPFSILTFYDMTEDIGQFFYFGPSLVSLFHFTSKHRKPGLCLRVRQVWPPRTPSVVTFAGSPPVKSTSFAGQAQSLPLGHSCSSGFHFSQFPSQDLQS